MVDSFHSKYSQSDETDRTILQPPPPQTEETAATVFVAQPKQTDVNALRTARGESGRVVLKPGERFGKYSIQRKLGEGAMGAVFLALDTTLDRQVALKVPFFREGDGREVIDRFYREARAMATVHHPNICPVFEVDDVEGVHYLTMAFIEGRPLSDFVKRKKRMPGRAVAAVMRKLAFALQEAHEKGVVHRDLKPANIMVDKRNEPIVMDFGLAQRRGSGEAELTMGGQILGSPAYMSPEQVEGDQKKVGPRSDIYALGVIMYQMLTGRLPFEGSVGAVLGKIMTQEPAPPSTLNKDVDPELESICLKCLSKSPADRYSTAGDLAEAIYLYMRRRPGGSEQTAEITRTQGRPEPVTPASAASSTNEMQALTRDLFDQLSAEEARRDTARSRRNLLVAMLFVALLGTAGWFGWKLTDKGQILVTSYDPAAVVVVKRDGQQVDEFSIGQRPGSSSYFSGSFEVAMKPNQPVVGARVKNGVFVLVRGQVMPVEILPPDYRDVSMFVIKHRGLVFIVGEQQVAATISQLPPGEFQIERLNLVSANDGQIKQLVDKMADMKQAPDVRITASPQVTNAGVKEFARVPTIQGLGISEASVTDEGVKELANLPNLKTLELNQVPVGDQAIAAIAEKAKSLEKLVATKTNITDDSLASLKKLPNLQSLEIDSPMVTDAGIKQLAEFPALKSVDIRDNPNISDEGVAALGQMKELEHLGLAGSAVKDEHIAALAKSKTLRELDLSRTQVTDLGMIPLKDSKLEKVELAETRVSESGAAFVQNSLVKCQVDSRFTPGGKAVGVARAARESVEAKQRQQSFADAKKVPIEFTNSIGMKLRLIPPGTFTMGSAESEIALLSASITDPATLATLKSELPARQVTLTRPYYLGTHEVTQTQFQIVMRTNPSKAEFRDPQKPVGMVPWTAAAQFCNQLSVLEKLKPCYEPDGGTGWKLTADGNGYRLPSEAEWEYACRAGTTTAYSFADSAAEIEEYGWAFNLSPANERGGQKLPNAFGLFDMYGNHWEWVEDLDQPYRPEDVTDPRVVIGTGNRITRGGSWYHGAARVRSAARVGQLAHMTYPASGFRIVLAGRPPVRSDTLTGGLVPRPAPRSHLAPRDEAVPKNATPPQVDSQKAHLAERDGYAWQLFTRQPRGGITELSWSGDNRWLAARVPSERAVRIFDVASGELRHIVPGLVGATDMTWSLDGRLLAIATEQEVHIFSAESGERRLLPLQLRELSWSRDGQWFSGLAGNVVCVVRPDGTDVRFLDHPTPVQLATWSSSTDALATVDAANIRLWKADGTLGATIPGTSGFVSWHPDGSCFAVAGPMSDVIVWKTDGTKLATLPDHNQGVGLACFSPTGDGLVTTNLLGDVFYSPWPGAAGSTKLGNVGRWAASRCSWLDPGHLLLVNTERPWRSPSVSAIVVMKLANDRQSAAIQRIGLPGEESTCVAFDPRGLRFAAGVMPWSDHDGTALGQGFQKAIGLVQIFDVRGQVERTLTEESPMIVDLAWNLATAARRDPAGPEAKIALLTRDSVVRIHQPDGRMIAIRRGLPWSAECLAWHRDGEHLAAMDGNGHVLIWDGAGNVVREIEGDLARPNFCSYGHAMAFHPTDDNLLAIAGNKGVRLLAWRDSNAKPLDLDVPDAWTGSIAWSRDGQWLASGTYYGKLELRFWTLQGKLGPVVPLGGAGNFVDWLPDGSGVLTSPMPVLVTRSPAKNTKLIERLSAEARDAVWTPNGRGFVLAGDGGVKLFRSDGQPGPALEFAELSARRVRFSPDGRVLAAGGKPGLRVWDVKTRQIDRIVLPLLNDQSLVLSPTGEILHGTPAARAELLYVVEPAPGRLRLLTPDEFDGSSTPGPAPRPIKAPNLGPGNTVVPPEDLNGKNVGTAPARPGWPLAPSKREDIVWLQGLKGTLTLRSAPKTEMTIGPSDAIPDGPVTVVGLTISRDNGPAITDEVLARIATLVDLESLVFSFAIPASAVTKDGLPKLAALVNLRSLTLGRIGTADTDPVFFGSLKNLESLSLQYPAYTGWEPLVGHLPRFKELWLHNVDKFRPDQLGTRPRLTSLKLTGFPPTRPARDEAAKRVSELAPWCRISLDNASAGDNPVVIEPTSSPPTN